MAGFEAKFHGSWQGVAVLKTATADKLMIRNEDIMKLSALKQGSLNFAEKAVICTLLGELNCYRALAWRRSYGWIN
jgi:hypothetical protein